ncbi:MAG: hypothetical protein ACYC1C_14685 [Chloroflexota bacterium]
MKGATPAFHELGHRLIAGEAATQANPTDTVAATEAVLEKLDTRLTILFGREGFRSLLARALHIAKGEHPLLAAVEATPAGGNPAAAIHLQGLRESTASGDPATVEEGLAALVGNFIWLLARFIGRSTTLRETQRIWPDLSLPETGPGEREAQE